MITKEEQFWNWFRENQENLHNIEELQKLKGEFVREFSGFLSYLGRRGDCYDGTYPLEKKRNDPHAGVIRLFFPEEEKAYHLLFNEFQFFDETTIGMSWFNQNE